MSRNPVSLADLLTAIAQAAPDEKAGAALSVGYRQRDAKGNRDSAQPLPALKPPETEPAPEPVADPEADTERLRKPQPTPAEVEQAAPHFWRVLAVQAHSPAPSEAEGWLTSLQPSTADFVSDLHVLLPASKPLASPARAAVALRRILAARTPGRRVDIARAVNLIATARTFRRLPMQALSRWPSTLQVLVDNSERLRPLTRDYAPWLSALQKTLRSRMRLRQVRGLPVETGAAGRPRLPVALDGSAVLVLGDGGLYGDAGAALHWSALSRRVRDAGGRTLVLAPMPAGMDPVTAQAGMTVWRFDETGVKACARRIHGVAPAPLAERDEQRVLRAALFANPWVGADLLRRLRQLIARHGIAVDLRDEIALWHDKAVRSSALACRLEPKAQQAARTRLQLLPPALQQAIAAMHWQTLLAGSPLVRAEFALAMQDQLDADSALANVIAAGREAGDQVMRLAAALEWRDAGGGESLAGELNGFIRGMQRRNPDVLERAGPGLRAAWVVAHRDELTAGVAQLPAGITQQDLAILMPSVPGDAALALGVRSGPEGDSLMLLDAESPQHVATRLADLPRAMPYATVQADPAARSEADRFVLVWRGVRRAVRAGEVNAQDFVNCLAGTKLRAVIDGVSGRNVDIVGELVGTATKASHAAIDDERSAIEFLAKLRHWTGVRKHDEFRLRDWADALLKAWAVAAGAEDDGVVGRSSNPSATLTRLQALPLNVETIYRIETSSKTLWVDAANRPAWADEIFCERGALMARVMDEQSPDQKKRLLRWLHGSEWPVRGGDGQNSYTFPNGFWWDAGEALTILLDREGGFVKPEWAARHGVDEHGYWAEFELQRIVQRMRFIPPGRFWMGSPLAEEGRSDDETLHPVTLTRGFWLADTACTQALWQAVTGKLPDHQQGTDANLPVVMISHADITRQFLPALERHLPGFHPRLPTEAEWEFAARAGTQTAYSWGDDASPDRMNFGDVEKQGAGRHIPVRSFSANPWGLWQMHGNVWEWCADGLADYSVDEALDPIAGQSAGRVLRGGSWFDDARLCRSALRYAFDPGFRSGDIGFRLARGLPEAGRAEPGGRGAPVLPAEPAAFSEPPDGLWDKLKRSSARKSSERRPLPGPKKRKK